MPVEQVGPTPPHVLPGVTSRRVVVQFHPSINLPYDDGATATLEALGVGPWAGAGSGPTLRPLFWSLPPTTIQALIQQAQATDPTYQPAHLLGYFVIDVPTGASPSALVQTLRDATALVSTAYIDPLPSPPPVNAADDPYSPFQGHLNEQPEGIDARYAWGIAGGDGAGQSLVDMEQGWAFAHEDLAAHGITLIGPWLNFTEIGHGTSVLGLVAAADNTVNCIGVTPALASVRCLGQWRDANTYEIAPPILHAVAAMSFGDVLLLEAHTDFEVAENVTVPQVPVEVVPAVFDAIRLATALGITVVEAAGNGGVDLDALEVFGKKVMDLTSADFRDSGAIVVGASYYSDPVHKKLVESCRGRRVDCFAQGDGVITLSTDEAGTDLDGSTFSFSGTSSASAIVAGAALSVQGVAQHLEQDGTGPRLPAWTLREVLRNPETGTASEFPNTDRIGVMPDLRKILGPPGLGYAPDVYLRDFVGDTGVPHNGSISTSPDVIVRASLVADPDGELGEASAESSTLGSTVTSGGDHFVYVRVRNRGGSLATDATATVYWSPPSTLVHPSDWNLIGSTVIPLVLDDEKLVVSPPITWSEAVLPPKGHYCFVATVGTALDPVPAPSEIFDWDTFRQYIRVNNNVTWRNFNVVDEAVDAFAVAPAFILPFVMPGAPDRTRPFAFEVTARLPRGASAHLEVPDIFTHLWRLPRSRCLRGEESGRVRVPIKPSGVTRFPEAPLPAKVKNPFRLLVTLPGSARGKEFELFARQLYKREEVGRVTWRLRPPAPREH